MLPENFNNMDTMSRRTWIHDKLISGSYVIEFTKVNGEVRQMPCTLQSNIVPKTISETPAKARKFNPDVLSVWCLDRNEWRSFKLANVTNMEVYHG